MAKRTLRRSLDASSFLRLLRVGLCVSVGVGLSASASFATPKRVSAQATGYELSLQGYPRVIRGDVLRFSGTAYRVNGLANLSPLSNGEVNVKIDTRSRDGRSRTVVAEETFSTNTRGEFTIAIPTPPRELSGPQLLISVVGKNARDAREFRFPVTIESAVRVQALTDRNRYEPGETVNYFARITDRRNGAPVAGSRYQLTVNGPTGEVTQREGEFSDSGAVSLSFPIPEGSRDGMYRADLRTTDARGAGVVTRGFQVGRRTVERMTVEVKLDRKVVRPGGTVSGAVSVSTPSGTPIAGANVTLARPDQAPIELLTNPQGIATFRFDATRFLIGDVVDRQLVVIARHAAHGSLRAISRFRIARTEWTVAAVAEGGAIVAGVDAEAIVLVTDLDQQPAPAGTEITFSGPAVRGPQSARVDRHGFAVLPLRIEEGAAGPVVACGGQVATRVFVEVNAGRPYRAEVCLPVAPRATLRITADPSATGEVTFEVERSPSARGRPVLVQAITAQRIVGVTTLAANRTTGSLALPRVNGVVTLRARPALSHSTVPNADALGGASYGTGSHTAVLMRPADAFDVTLVPGAPRYEIGQQADIAIKTSVAAPRAWSALVVRDLAQHGGETDFTMDWVENALDDQKALSPSTEDPRLLLRAALAHLLRRDSVPSRPMPLVRVPWYGAEPGARHDDQMRDPIALRDEYLRRGTGRLMVMIEQQVAQLAGRTANREGFVRTRGGRTSFDPNAITTLVEARRLPSGLANTLGGRRMSIGMLEASDPAFRFDNVAKRVARRQLVTLLTALVGFTNPDDVQAARASAGQPPERWLSRLVQLGAITQQALVDPWGRAFSLRRVANPRFLISDRAPSFELASAGPDGRFGTADDVRDPFARVLPEGSVYAVASGEDALMKNIAALSPSANVLGAMARAYRTVSLSQIEERRRAAVSARASEGAMVEDEESMDADGVLDSSDLMLGASGEAQSTGYGRGAGGFRARRARPTNAPAPPPAASPVAADEANVLSALGAERSESVLEVASERIRQDFPATLFFAGEIPLTGQETSVSFPLADALTTYRVEAITWTATGWSTNANVELSVDQRATVDAPVPPFASVGDVLALPVRVQNRTADPIRVLVDATGEEVSFATAPPQALEIPGREAIETIVEVRLERAGEGHVVIRAVDADSRAPLDAVRRPLKIREEGRRVRQNLDLFVEGNERITIAVPNLASTRGPAQIRVAPGIALFGDLNTIQWHDRALVQLFTGDEIDADLVRVSRGMLDVAHPDERRPLRRGGLEVASAVSILWDTPDVPDSVMRRGLRAISDLPPPQCAIALQRLAGAIRSEQRTAVRTDLLDTVNLLRTRAGDHAIETTDQPETFAAAAAALALSGDGGARTRELLRRAEEFVLTLEDEAFLETQSQAGLQSARVIPSSHMAIAYAALGERGKAMPFVRHLASLTRGTASGWDANMRGAAMLALCVLHPNNDLNSVSVDGQELTLATTRLPLRSGEERVFSVATSDALGTPGQHVVNINANGFALVFVDLTYALPWSVAPERPLLMDIEVEGDPGPRDTRAGLALSLKNRDVGTIVSPILEVDIPAGTELDEPTREALARWTTELPTLEDRTMTLHLRNLAPGASVRLPLPLRWAVGGELRGLGVAVREGRARELPREAILAPRTLSIANTGERAEEIEHRERGGEPITPVPVPLPEPFRLDALEVPR